MILTERPKILNICFRILSLRAGFSLILWSLLGIGLYYPYYYHVFTSEIPFDDVLAEAVWRLLKASCVILLPGTLGFLFRNIQSINNENELHISRNSEVLPLVVLSVFDKLLGVADYFSQPTHLRLDVWMTSLLGDIFYDFIIINSGIGICLFIMQMRKQCFCVWLADKVNRNNHSIWNWSGNIVL